MKTLEDILIARNELERIYTGALALHLWRAVRKGEESKNTLHPELASRALGRGRVRQPDVETYLRNGCQWVRAKVGMGVSLFDRASAFPSGGWDYFVIPKGTIIPVGIVITKDQYVDRYAATHYSVSPNYDMPATHYISLLNQLALNARQRQKEVVNG